MLKDGTNSDLLVAIGEALQERRIFLNLSQLELSQSTGLQRAYISDVERGRRNITILTLKKLSEELETSPAEILRVAHYKLTRKPGRARAK